MQFFSRVVKELKVLGHGMFSVIYVMSESLPSHVTRVHWVWGMFLLLLDFVQILRDLLRSQYGWNRIFTDIYAETDVLKLVFGLNIVGKRVLALMSNLLIAIVAATTFYVILGFRSPRFERIWAAKLLRSLGTVCVTALFPTVFEYGVLAVTCEFWQDNAVPGECDMSGGRIVLAIVAGLLVSFHFCFGIIVSLFFLEINPLSKDPLACFLGRSEALYVVVKTLVILGPIVSSRWVPITVVASTIISFVTLLLHIYEQPFHSHSTNVFRGGMEGGVFVMCLGTLLALSQVAYAEMITVGLMVIFVPLGGAACSWRRRSVLKNCRKLKATLFPASCPPIFASGCLAQGMGDSIFLDSKDTTSRRASAPGPPPCPQSPRSPRSGLAGSRGRSPGPMTIPRLHSQAGSEQQLFAEPHGIDKAIVDSLGIRGVSQATVTEDFFTATADQKHSFFWSDTDAVVACRALLQNHSKEDLHTVKTVLVATLEQEPQALYTGLWLSALVLLVLRDLGLATSLLDALDKLSPGLKLDVWYLRFAIRSMMGQVMKSSVLGSNMTAIGMMEITKEQENAVNFHHDAVRNLRLFWRDAATGRDSLYICSRIDNFFSSCDKASASFAELFSRFPSSPELLRANAQFVEDVQCNRPLAEEMRSRAEQLDDIGTGGEDGGPSFATASGSVGKSSHTASSTGMRQGGGSEQQWTQLVLQLEVHSLQTASRTVRWAVLIMVVFLLLGLLVMDLVLFSGNAEKSIAEIDSVNIMRDTVVESAAAVRLMVHAAAAYQLVSNSTTATELQAARTTVQTLAGEIPLITETLFGITSPKAQNVLQLPLSIREPAAHGWWRYAQDRPNLLDSLDSMSRSMLSAAELPPNKLGSPRVWDEEPNLLELRMLRGMYNLIPLLDSLDNVAIYLEYSVQSFADNVYLAVALNAVAVVMLSFLVDSIVRRSTWQALVYLRTATTVSAVMALLPKRAKRNMVKFYATIDERLRRQHSGYDSDRISEPDQSQNNDEAAEFSSWRDRSSTDRKPESQRGSRRHSRSPSPRDNKERESDNDDDTDGEGGHSESNDSKADYNSEGSCSVDIDEHIAAFSKQPRVDMVTRMMGDAFMESQETASAESRPSSAAALENTKAGTVPKSPTTSETADIATLMTQSDLDPNDLKEATDGLAVNGANGVHKIGIADAGFVSGNGTLDADGGTELPWTYGSQPERKRAPKILLGNALPAMPPNPNGTTNFSSFTTPPPTTTTSGENGPEPWPMPHRPVPSSLHKHSHKPKPTPFLSKEDSPVQKTSVRFEPTEPSVRSEKFTALPKTIPYKVAIRHSLLSVSLIVVFAALASMFMEGASGAGPLAVYYEEVSTFLADHRPPPAFAMEAYFHALSLPLIQGAEQRAVMDDFHFAEMEFHRSIAKWQSRFTHADRRQWVHGLQFSGSVFFNKMHDEAMPALATGNHTLIEEVYSEVRILFHKHEEIVRETVVAAVADAGKISTQFDRLYKTANDQLIGATCAITFFVCFAVLSIHIELFSTVASALRRSRFSWLQRLSRSTSGVFPVSEAGIMPAPVWKRPPRSLGSTASATSGASTSVELAQDAHRRKLEVLVFVLGLGALAAITITGAQTHMGDAVAFEQKKMINEFITEILPPDCFFLEGFMLTTEATMFQRPFDAATLSKLEEGYNRCFSSWSNKLDGIIKEVFLVDAFTPGKQLAREIVRDQSGHTVSRRDWLLLLPLFRQHRVSIQSTTKLGLLRLQSSLAHIEKDIALSRIALPALVVVLTLCFVCLLWILFDDDDVTSARSAVMEKTNKHFADKLRTLRPRLNEGAPLYLWPAVHWTVYVLLPLLSILGVALPLRYLDDITNIAPLVNQSNRRRYGTLFAIQLVSGASYGDRLTGYDAFKLRSNALTNARILRLSNTYIINGGDLHINAGTAHNFPRIDAIMNRPPPDDNTDVNTPFYSFIAGGLQDSILGALELVEHLAAAVNASDLPPESTMYVSQDKAGVIRLEGLGSVPELADKRWNLHPELWPQMGVLTGAIRSAVSKGSERVQAELHSVFRSLFSSVRMELRGLFGMNSSFVLLVFFGIFRQTVVTLYAEVARTRRFLSYMPLHTFNPQTVANIRATFADEED